MGTTGAQNGGVLEYSIDGDASWFDVLSGDGVGIAENPNRFLAGGYDATLPCCGTPLAGRAGWSGLGDWQQVRLDLADFAGRTVHLRWRFGALDSSAGEGWWLDDLELLGLAGCPLETIFNDGFESGDLSAWSAAVR